MCFMDQVHLDPEHHTEVGANRYPNAEGHTLADAHRMHIEVPLGVKSIEKWLLFASFCIPEGCSVDSGPIMAQDCNEP